MSASNNRFEPHSTEGCFILTEHAKERMAMRGLRADAIDAALTYGRVVYVRGADIYAVGRKEIARYAEEGIDLAAYDGVQVVVTAERIILTVYRNRSFNGLRDRHGCRRRPLALAA
jgi:hypothetical protein